MENEKPITFELSNDDLLILQAGIRAGKARKVFMTTKGLMELQEVMLKEPKQILAGNPTDGYIRVSTNRF